MLGSLILCLKGMRILYVFLFKGPLICPPEMKRKPFRMDQFADLEP